LPKDNKTNTTINLIAVIAIVGFMSREVKAQPLRISIET
jgi:hypothetical protein